MYEENEVPLPAGDGATMFAAELAAVARQLESPCRDDDVVQLAVRGVQRPFAVICRRLLLPGSRVEGWGHVCELGRLANDGKACLMCLAHKSNLDVPTLYAILKDQGNDEVFDRIVWLAGRKLSEDEPLTRTLIRSCNRLVLTPRSWFAQAHSQREVREARRANRRAQRAMLNMRHGGWIFGLFPSGTRQRYHDDASVHAIPETDTYVKLFDYMVLGNIAGCTLPVSRDRDFLRETPKLDRVVYTFGPAIETQQWRRHAQQRFPALDQRSAVAHAMEEAIANLGRP